ncbi:MAG: hypothetical protein Q7T33_15235, partial [Dehalococcoidia bacterium]|nr:hypothetical protein [Dehalococcoidia bacterium]
MRRLTGFVFVPAVTALLIAIVVAVAAIGFFGRDANAAGTINFVGIDVVTTGNAATTINGHGYYSVFDGGVDINRSNTITAADNGSLPTGCGSYNVIAGKVDIDGSATITAADNGTLPAGCGSYNVIGGSVDINGSGTITIADDGALQASDVVLATDVQTCISVINGTTFEIDVVLNGLPPDATPTATGDRLAGVNYDIDYDGAIVKLGNDDDLDGLWDEDTLIGDTDQDSDGSDGEEGNDDPNLIGATIGHNTSFLLNGANDFSKGNGADTATWSDFHSSYFKLSGFAIGPKSGVLERLTVTAVGAGLTTLNLRDGASAAPTMGDDASANFTIANGGNGDAQIAVDEPCPTAATPTATATATPAPGTITVIKDAVPDDAQDFSFSGTCFAAFSLDDDANATLSNTKTEAHAADTCTVIEDGPPAGWTLTAIDCTDPSGGTTTNVGTRTASIDLAAGETVVCTYTNTGGGTITIIKDAVPDDAQDFSFSGTCFAAFSLDDDANATLLNTKTTGHAPGTCTVIEDGPPATWNLTALVCTDPSGGTTTSVGTRTASIDLAPGETVSCTFTNTKGSSITIIKDAVPDDAQDFSFSGTCFAAFSLDDDADITLSNTKTEAHAASTCTVIEDAPAATWNLTALVCTDPSGGTTTSVGTRTASIDLAAG